MLELGPIARSIARSSGKPALGLEKNQAGVGENKAPWGLISQEGTRFSLRSILPLD